MWLGKAGFGKGEGCKCARELRRPPPTPGIRPSPLEATTAPRQGSAQTAQKRIVSKGRKAHCMARGAPTATATNCNRLQECNRPHVQQAKSETSHPCGSAPIDARPSRRVAGSGPRADVANVASAGFGCVLGFGGCVFGFGAAGQTRCRTFRVAESHVDSARSSANGKGGRCVERAEIAHALRAVVQAKRAGGAAVQCAVQRDGPRYRVAARGSGRGERPAAPPPLGALEVRQK